MRGGIASWPRNCAAASSLDKNFARLRVRVTDKTALVEEFCAAGILILQILQELQGCNYG